MTAKKKTPKRMIKTSARAGMLWRHKNQAQDELVTKSILNIRNAHDCEKDTQEND